MREFEKIGLDSLYNLLGSVSVAFLTFFITIFITRKLGPEDYGIFSYVFSVFSLLPQFCLLSLNTILSRNTAFHVGKNDPSAIKSYFLQFSKIVFLTTAAISLGLLAVIFAFPDLIPFSNFLVMFIPYLFLINFFTLITSGSLSGLRKFGLVNSLTVASRALLLLFVLLLIGQRVSGVIVSYTVSLAVPLAISIFFVHRLILSRGKTKKISLKETFSFSLPFFIAQILFGILLYFNVFALTYFAPKFGFDDVGFYSLAFHIELFLETLLLFVANSITPAISQFYGANDFSRVKKIFTLGMKYTFIFVFPITFSLVAVADVLIRDVFTKSYTESTIVLQILAFTLIATMMLRSLVSIVLAKKLVTLYLYLAIALALITIPLTFLLTSQFSVFGAAIARMVPLVVLTLIFTAIIIKKAGLTVPSRDLLLEFTGSFIFLLLFLAPRSLIYSVVFFIGSSIIYLLFLYLTKVISKNDIQIARVFLTFLRR